MKLEFAVYAAVNGYDWQPGTLIPRQDLYHYQTIVTPLPRYEMGDDDFGGIFADGMHVVFYRYLQARGVSATDSGRRPSVCLILGRCNRAEVGKVDFKEIFRLPVMNAATASVSPCVEYKGGPAHAVQMDPKRAGTISDLDFLTEIGTWLSGLHDEAGWIKICGTWPKLNFSVGIRPKPAPVRQRIKSLEGLTKPDRGGVSDPVKGVGEKAGGTSGGRSPGGLLGYVVVAIVFAVTGIVLGWQAKTYSEKCKGFVFSFPAGQNEYPAQDEGATFSEQMPTKANQDRSFKRTHNVELDSFKNVIEDSAANKDREVGHE